MALDRLGVAAERVEHPLHRLLAEPAGRLDALAEPGDDRLALELAQLAAVELGDEQSRGVGSDVDDRDAAHRATSSRCSRSELARESAPADSPPCLLGPLTRPGGASGGRRARPAGSQPPSPPSSHAWARWRSRRAAPRAGWGRRAAD